jgi:hypothetical protein
MTRHQGQPFGGCDIDRFTDAKTPHPS